MSEAHPHQSAPEFERPDFMVLLGLLPPYTLEDVKQAYLSKVKEIHPDHNGDPEEFQKIQEAYQRAQAFVEFRGDRRGWIANRMEEYLGVLEVVERLGQFGAEVETDSVDWLTRSVGDFAELTESIVGVRLAGAANGDEVIAYMVSNHDRLLELRRLELPGCTVSDGVVRQLSVFRRLAHLDLSNTPIHWEALHVLDWLPDLETLSIEGTAIKWWTRRKIAAQMRRKRKLAAASRAIHPTRIR